MAAWPPLRAGRWYLRGELGSKGMSIKDFEGTCRGVQDARGLAWRPENRDRLPGDGRPEDAIVDHDQAMALETDRYKASGDWGNGPEEDGEMICSWAIHLGER